MSTDNTPTDPTTHDRLRAALERLVDEAQAMRGNHGHRRTCDRDHSAVPNPSGTYHSCRTLTDAIHDARAVLATPAPAADEARCGWMQMTDFDRDPLCVLPKGHDGDHQPAPTPAPPTPPATEPVAALVEAFMLALVDDRYGLSRYGAHAKNVQTVAEVRARLDAIVAAARAEVDVERLARALHDQGFGCNAYRCSLGRGSSADAHEQDARFLAAAYREHPDDR